MLVARGRAGRPRGWSPTWSARRGRDADGAGAARASSRRALPDYMVPAAFVPLAGPAADRQRQGGPPGPAGAGRAAAGAGRRTSRRARRSRRCWRRSGREVLRAASGWAATTTSSTSAATRCWRPRCCPALRERARRRAAAARRCSRRRRSAALAARIEAARAGRRGAEAAASACPAPREAAICRSPSPRSASGSSTSSSRARAVYNIPVAVRLTGRARRRGPAPGARRGGAPPRGAAHHLRRARRPAGAGDPRRISRRPCRWSTSSALPEAGEARPAGVSAEASRRPFDLARGPLLRAALLRLARGASTSLLLTMHHIVSDGWSHGGAAARAGGALRGPSPQGEPSPLPELPVQYADFALWQRSWLPGEAPGGAARLLARAAGRGAAAARAAADRPRPAVPELPRRDACPSRSAEPLSAAAAGALARAEGATLFMVLLGGLRGAAAPLLRPGRRRWWARPIAGRDRPEIEGLIGFFVNTLVLRADLGGGPERPRAARPGARGGPGGLRAPGPAVRDAGRGAGPGAQPEPLAAVPGDARPSRTLRRTEAPGAARADAGAAGRRGSRSRSSTSR